MQIRQYDTMLLALAIKQAGGTLLLEKQTFIDLVDDFEILVSKDANENALLTLVEDEEPVAKIRTERAAEQLKAEKRRSLVVPN